MRSRLLAGTTAASVAAGAVFVWAACLPDLSIAVPAACGDGIIEPDAGEECDPGGTDAGGTKAGCSSTCAILCDSGVSPFVDSTTNHCYFGVSGNSPLTDAAAACEANGGHIVRFVDRQEYTLVATKAATSPFWVGIALTAKNQDSWLPVEATPEPGWDPGCSGCFAAFDGGPLKGDCLTGSTDEQPWSESLCTFHEYPQCEREPPGTRVFSCPAGSCFTVRASTKQYVLLSTSMGNTQLEANAADLACGQLGGRLVVFASSEEREQVSYELAGRASDFWIGLAAGPGGWAWDTGGGLSPLPWGEGQPVATPDGGGRAYVHIAPGVVDSELARVGNAADAGGEQHYVVCEM